MPSRQPTNRSFPWRTGNHFKLLNDGPQFYPRMLEAIANARRHVLLEMYLVQSSKVASSFIDALQAAASRGVRIALLFDGFGSLGLKSEDRARLAAQGMELRFYNPPGW